jgi:hypothetical protein
MELRRALTALTSLRLTIVLLILSIILVFAATLDQVHLGVWGVQQKYFRAFFVFDRLAGTSITVPVFPGGYLLGGVLILNLVAAHIYRFRRSWKQTGLWLTHSGLILLLVGEGLAGLMQEDSQMRITEGQTRRYAESFHDSELAVIETTNPQFDEVVAIPTRWLQQSAPIQNAKLPFVVRPIVYYANATLLPRKQAPNAAPVMATMGFGTDTVAVPAPTTTKDGEVNWPTAYIELQSPEGSLGTYLVSAMLLQPEDFTYQNRTFRLALREKRDYLPFSLTLQKFTHAVYTGTDIPKDFASTVRLRSDDRHDDRQVRIFMNNPLRYGGLAFYQAGYDPNNERTSVLQVVRNPSWRWPYIACSLIALGLVLQFGQHLWRFLRKRRSPLRAAAGNAGRVVGGGPAPAFK